MASKWVIPLESGLGILPVSPLKTNSRNDTWDPEGWLPQIVPLQCNWPKWPTTALQVRSPPGTQ